MALLHVNFFSAVLGMNMSADVILPENTSGKIGISGAAEPSYKTLYLLHGMSDDHTAWQRYSSVERYVSNKNLAVVMPDVHLSWYTDMAHGHKYFTYITEELPAVCRSFFRGMSDKYEDNFIAGLSMGGYGAIKAALSTGGKFCAAASLSGALDIEHMHTEKKIAVENKTYWEDIFGDLEHFAGSENDLFALAERKVAAKTVLPRLYMWCGTEDFLYAENISAKKKFTELGYDLTYSESPGDHCWDNWDPEIKRVLDWLMPD